LAQNLIGIGSLVVIFKCGLFLGRTALIPKSIVRILTIYLGLLLLTVMMLSLFSSDNNYAFGSINFNFAAAGDFDCNNNTKDTIENIVDKNPELVLGLGDYSYKTTRQCWMDIMEPLNNIKIAIGNHEAISNGRTSLSPDEFEELMEDFDLTTQYYSFNHENVHFLSLSTELQDMQQEKNQFNFVSNDLFNASEDPEIDWIIIFFHKPFFASATIHHGPEETERLRGIFHPLFEKYNVNLVLQGHNHNYERTKPIKCGSSEISQGIVYIVAGTAGAPLHNFVDDKNACHQSDAQYRGHGFLNVEVVGKERLEAQFYSNKDRKVADEFTISKNND
jgi:hypothetical protein